MNAIRVPGIRQSTWIAAAVAATVAVGAGAAGIAAATGLGDDETTLTDTELARASRAALTEVGPATVTDAQRGPALSPALSASSESYTVDTRLPNGVEVAVQLDETFTVVWVSAPGWRGDAASVAEPRVLTAAELASVDRTTAGQAALAEVGSGTVTDFRRSRALDHAFEVEVTLDDGTQRVVELTERSQVVSSDRPTLR
ncbi:hypothetical protein E3O53_01140 [Cryobacterium sp. TMT2-18-3]|uniref:hypothetical protein n=1 Tax=unclassified Cryobacterium TaxID=2649013 RepID=UPI001069159D|nr:MULTISPECIES: hypothetical protein [unclassified Cryobacterium]TFC26497.1 hypothetical protein E3O22_12810 [Cryobacterium sp. TMT2-18-2]TFC36191.1 hypothetical protein E3O18_08030 [Cryobacterium sp. TMT2-42-4]TFC59534.1 hypothetical protein E3O62_09020 [Cryobacterium sp. TMT2-15-1]TFC68052.1 hypothetical protein E3O53_01140 [Cryobacterium sp. TMT2-18-3]